MLARSIKKVLLAIMLLVSFWLLRRSTDGLDGTEFAGGRLTGPMLDVCEVGMIALLVAVILVYWLPRLASSIALVASVCCLPLPLYFFAPGPFRAVVKGEWSVPLQSNFVWTHWTLLPIFAILFTMAAAVFALFTPRTAAIGK